MKKWVNSVQNVEEYNTPVTVGSDHRILTAMVKLRLRAPKNMPNAARSFNFKAPCFNRDRQKYQERDFTTSKGAEVTL